MELRGIIYKKGTEDDNFFGIQDSDLMERRMPI